MTDTQHTPGPWHWDGDVCSYDKENEAPWLCSSEDNPILSGEIGCDTEANARLIAAAPDLLGALEALDKGWTEDVPEGPDGEFRGGFSIHDEHKVIWKQARAAIAKAKGDS